MPSGIAKVKGAPAGDLADAVIDVFLSPAAQTILADKAFVAPTNKATPNARGISRQRIAVRAGLGVLRQEARRLGRSLGEGDDMTTIAAASPHLVIGNVSKRFGATTVLDRIDLTIRRGELVTLLGPSGCGKTTLLRVVAGLTQPDNGQVELAGRDITHVPPHRRNVGVVFQSYALFPHLTVAGNVAFGLKVRGCERSKIDAAVAARAVAGQARPSRIATDFGAVRAASSSASRLPAPSRSNRTCCCSTKRCPRSIASCARKCRSNCAACCRTSAPPRSSSPTTRKRR